MSAKPFVTTVVGSMPKRPWLFTANHTSDGRRDHFGDPGSWKFDGDMLKLAQDDATRLIIREQEDAGIVSFLMVSSGD